MGSDGNIQAVEGPSLSGESSRPEDPPGTDAHQALIAELQEQREKIKQGGGPGRIEVQHAKGKLSARERITRLLDEGI